MTILRRQHTVPLDWLVREWLLDWNWNDTSWSWANLTISNLTYATTDKWYQAKMPVFAASSIAYGAPFQRSNGQAIAMSVWIKRTSSWTYQDIIVNRDASYYNYMLYIHATWDKIGFHGTAQNAWSYTPPLNTWTHIVAQVSTWQQLTIWINGVLTDTFNGYTYQTQTPTQMNIWQFANSEHFLWNIQWARIYDRILSEDEIKNLYKEWLRLLGFSQGPSTSSVLDYTRMDFATDDTQTNGWTRTTYGSWAVTWWNLVTYPNDGRVWIWKAYAAPLWVWSVLKTRYLADNDTWWHNNWHQFGNSNADIKVTFWIWSSTVWGYTARARVYNSAGTVVYESATWISAGTWYVIRSEITATWYKFQIWDTTETTKLHEYLLTDTVYPYIRIEMWQGTWNPSYMDWLEASIYSNSSVPFTGKYLPEEFSEGLEFLYTGKNASNSVYDQSGKGIVWTAANVVFAAQNAKWLFPMTFNGSSSKIEMWATMRLTGSFTINALIKTSATGSYKLVAQSYSQLTPAVSWWQISIQNTNVVWFSIWKNTGYTINTDYKSAIWTINVCDGKNHLVSCVYDWATMKIYIDGTLDVSVAWTFWPAYQTDCKWCIGTNNYQQTLYTDWYSGDINFVSWHLKVYTKNQIKRLFTSLFFT